MSSKIREALYELEVCTLNVANLICIFLKTQKTYPQMSDIIKQAAFKLYLVLKGKVDSSHGIHHANAVLGHAQKALKYQKEPMTSDQILAVQLAALLHDGDDGKFFKDTNNSETILNELVTCEVRDLVLHMINLVSCSKNGNSKEGVEFEWMLYPRYADRLEALGEIGIWRCWQYTQHVKRPVVSPDTTFAKSLEELELSAPASKFENYVSKQGKVGSSSFIDHFYDKLLHICNLGENPYFKEEAAKRKLIMQDFLIDFGQNEKVNQAFINKLVDKFQ